MKRNSILIKLTVKFTPFIDFNQGLLKPLRFAFPVGRNNKDDRELYIICVYGTLKLAAVLYEHLT